MGQVPRELTPLESALHFFGAELRHWRTLRELSQEALGRRTHDSGSLIGKIEKGERFPSLELTRRLDEALDTGHVLERLWPQVEQERANRSSRRSQRTGGTSAGDEASTVDLGLTWPRTPEATVEVVVELWRSELERRAVLLSAAWVASAYAVPTREWLLNHQDEFRQNRAGRAVGRSDVDALWEMCTAFADADHRLGGGYARSTLLHYINEVVLPLLQGSYTDAIGRELMAATARLCDLCGFMNFDEGSQGLAQRYFIQALRLAQASGNRALGAHILADMSMQAHHLGDPAQALDLASAGYRTARGCGSLSTAARCAALEGRAHALRGDQRACAQACAVAERALVRAVPAEEPAWIRFFTADQMAAEMLYMAGDLGRHADVQRHAPVVLASSGGMQRRRVLCTTTFAASYLPAEGNRGGDVDRACHLLGEVIPSLQSLKSARSVQRVNAVRRRLAPYASRPSVQELEHRLQATVVVGGPRA
jgi:DNA-binding XRE family transcriptional regulator